MQNRIWWAFLALLTFMTLWLWFPRATNEVSAENGDQLQEARSVLEVKPKPLPKVKTPKLAPLHPLYDPLARLLAGMPQISEEYAEWDQSSIVKEHQKAFNAGWKNLEDSRLKKMRVWRDQELVNINKDARPVFYPFSGPDILNAQELFPNAPYYQLFALEPVGSVPDINQLKGAFLQNYLYNVRQALSEIFQRNYFITLRMGKAFNSNLKGVLPVLMVFIAREGGQIIDIEALDIDPEGKVVLSPLHKNKLRGVRIHFRTKNNTKTRYVDYVSGNIANQGLKNAPELRKLFTQLDQPLTFVKSASYLLHTYPFSDIRNLIIEQSRYCIQDDTGVPYKYFKAAQWEVDLYGKYAPPIRDFNYGYQADLDQRFKKEADLIKPLDFTFGYHWWTDKSSIILAKNPS